MFMSLESMYLNTKPSSCKQPDWERIVRLCKAKIEEKYPEYGNSWTEKRTLSWWQDRLGGEISEVIKSKYSPEQRQKEIIDAINILAMMFHEAQGQYWDEVVSSRLGLG